MSNTLINFLSNKTNLVILNLLLIGLVAYLIQDISLGQQLFIIGCVICIGSVSHLMGVSKGLFIATIHKKEIDEFVKYVDQQENDEDIDKLIEHIEKKYNEENEEK